MITHTQTAIDPVSGAALAYVIIHLLDCFEVTRDTVRVFRSNSIEACHRFISADAIGW